MIISGMCETGERQNKARVSTCADVQLQATLRGRGAEVDEWYEERGRVGGGSGE